MNTAAYILNRTGVSSIDSKSPHEIWVGKKPAISHLRVVGTTCYVHVPDQKRRKLDKKSLKCVLMGYDGDDSYRVWHQESNSVMRSRDVWFNKGILFKPKDSIETPISFGPLNAYETNLEDCSSDHTDGSEMHHNDDQSSHENDNGEACGELKLIAQKIASFVTEY